MWLPVDLKPAASTAALELDVIVPPSGNLRMAGRQLWLGPRFASRVVTVWADRTSIHLSLDGTLLKTLPSIYSAAELAKLRRLLDARPGGPPPRAPAAQAPRLTHADVVEVDRQVNAAGLVGLDNRQFVSASTSPGRAEAHLLG